VFSIAVLHYFVMELADCEYNFNYDGEHFDIRIKSTTNTMRGMYWMPADNKKPVRAIIYVHGMNSLIVSERDSATVYNENDSVYFSCDHIGHGRSDGDPVSCTVEEIMDETLEVLKLVSVKFPGLPVFLKGHSLGGLVVLSLGLLRKEELLKFNVKGVIAISPYISSCPKRPIKLIESLLLFAASKYFPLIKVPSGPVSFSDDVPKQFGEWLVNAARAKGWVTPRMMVSSFKAITRIQALAEQWPKELPLLFEQGMLDNLVDPIANVDWAKRVAEKNEAKITIRTYERAPHQVSRCPYRGQSFRDIFAFINEVESMK
jgi:acylglycerol lipase